MNKIYCLISFIVGMIIAGILGVYYYHSHPRTIEIVKETPTETIVKVVPSDYESCIKCVKSEGKISEIINDKNVMHIMYEDDCKSADKYVKLKSYETRRNFLMFNILNSIDKNSYKNIGGDITYTYMLWGRLGLSGGIGGNGKFIITHAGIVWNF